MLALKWLEPQSTITQIANMKTKARAASISKVLPDRRFWQNIFVILRHAGQGRHAD
jgi:hypothetical protein